MRQLVVSDFHLDPTEPARYRVAMASLNRCHCDQLILAGDIFEAWVGDDNASSLDEEFLNFCGEFGADTRFILGNRDFLISAEYLAQHSIKLVDMVAESQLIIIHGDELCTLDHGYQDFKQEVRDPAWIKNFLEKPLGERQQIAQELRQASQETQANRAEAIGDAVDSEVNVWMSRFNTKLLVHGHTHRPAIHSTPHGLRAVSSDWRDSGVGVLIDHQGTQQTVSLIDLSPSATIEKEQWSRQAGTPEWKRNS
jgi:UDP-2,3-diacylglucosamine hydrolase